MILEPPASVQKLRTALQAKAKEKPDHRFYLPTRLNAEAEESPMGVAHEPVGVMTGGVTPSEEMVHISPMKVTPKLGKGAQDTWRLRWLRAAGLIKPAYSNDS